MELLGGWAGRVRRRALRAGVRSLGVAVAASGLSVIAPSAALAADSELEPVGSVDDYRTVSVVGDLIYYGADDGLRVTDGTPRGSRLIDDIVPTGPIVAVGETLFFPANDGVHGVELWASDGTEEGTRLVLDIDPQPVNSFYSGNGFPSRLTSVGDALYFTADDGVHGYEVWTSDGFAEKTRMVADLTPGASSSYPSELVVADGALYFVGARGMWTTDGTAEGTERVFGPGADLTVVGDDIYFRGGNELFSSTLWITDGTTGGTTRLLDTADVDGDNDLLGDLTAVGGVLYFTIGQLEPRRYGYHGAELWTSDGTVAGTRLAGNRSSDYRDLTDVDGVVYYVGSSDLVDYQLWSSSPATTEERLVADLGSYSDQKDTFHLAAVGGELYFALNRGYDRGYGRRVDAICTTKGVGSGITRVGADQTFDVRKILGVDGNLYVAERVVPPAAYFLWRTSLPTGSTPSPEPVHPPRTMLVSGPRAGASVESSSRDVTFEFAGASGDCAPVSVSFECGLDNAPYQPCSSPVTYPGLSNGRHSFAVRAVDAAGVRDPSPRTALFTVAWNNFGVSSRFERVVEDGAVKARVFVPGPGRLELARTRLVKPVGLDVAEDGRTIVRVEPTRKGLKKLRQDRRASKRGKVGRLKAETTFSYTPLDGTPNTVTRDFILKLRK